MSDQLHPLAPHHLPPFITAPGETDVLMVVMGIFLVVAVLAVGNIYLQLHTLPERMAHKSQKLQFEIVAVLGLLALFTHVHIFWIAGLLLAMIDLPDFSTPLRSIASSVERIAGGPLPDDECRRRKLWGGEERSGCQEGGRAGNACVKSQGGRPCLSC